MLTNGLMNTNGQVIRPIEELSLLVDGVVVKQVVLGSFMEGILGYWPLEIDREVEYVSSRIYAPYIPLTILIIKGVCLKYKYIVLLLGDRFLLLALDKRVNAEDIGDRFIRLMRAFHQLSP